MTDPRVEELLEATWMLEEEGTPLPVQGDDVVKTAADSGLIRKAPASPARADDDNDDDNAPLPSPQAWQLTAVGKDAARQIVRLHRLAECLLHDVLQVGDEQIDQDACRFEHVIRAELADKICTLLGHPFACPHGKAIPSGACCEKARTEGLQEISPLCDGQVGQDGVVAYLHARDQREVQKLMTIGVLPGSDIRLIRRFPSFVFQVGFSQFTVDRELAGKILVHWKQP